jgi:acyl-CoA dehydrogenase
MLLTTAVKDGEDYVINGSKWFITGAEGADFVIIMARAEDGSATMFLSDMNAPGLELVRKMDALDSCFTGGHGVLQFTNLRVPATQILGELGKGFKYAQIRLAPARLDTLPFRHAHRGADRRRRQPLREPRLRPLPLRLRG